MIMLVSAIGLVRGTGVMEIVPGDGQQLARANEIMGYVLEASQKR